MRDEQGRRKRRRDGGSAGPSQKKVSDSLDRRKTADSLAKVSVTVKFKVDVPQKQIPFVKTLTLTAGSNVECGVTP